MSFAAFLANQALGNNFFAKGASIIFSKLNFIKTIVANIGPRFAAIKAFFWEKEVEEKIFNSLKHRVKFSRCFLNSKAFLGLWITFFLDNLICGKIRSDNS